MVGKQNYKPAWVSSTIKKFLGYNLGIVRPDLIRRNLFIAAESSRMSYEHEPISPMFQIDVSADAEAEAGKGKQNDGNENALDLLTELVAGQKQQNRLLEELVHQQVAANTQRATELQQWKNANPELARSCRQAAETLSRVQTQFLDTLTEEIADSEEHLVEGDYMLNEFVDRFGPRLAHLNGVLQVLAQLGTSESNS
ncbi:hypothetical protein N9248_00585 [bacterium]|nr:hypothetical protein [bacterium]